MCGKILSLVTILIAVILAGLATFLPPEQIGHVIVAARFFDIMLPVLAVGALIKYVFKCNKSGCCDNGSTHTHTH